VLLSCQLALACQAREIDPPTGPAPTFLATVTVDLSRNRRAVNRRVLGSNVQWVDRGDEMLEPGSAGFAPVMLERARQLQPTVLRYPGGSQSDLYHWREGIGSLETRGSNEHFHTKKQQTVLFGTLELLRLCRELNAEPLITVNTASGTPEEAAAWVEFVNRSSLTAGPAGEALPRAELWEVGNEPYLRDAAHPELAVEPEIFAERANRFIRAMRNVDPRIQVGIPLHGDTLGNLRVAHFPGYEERVLSHVEEPFDFVSLHDAYLPFIWERDRRYRDEELFRALMGGYRLAEEDLERTRTLLRRRLPGRNVKIGITEYNALFTLGGKYDPYIATFGAALYVADLLRILSQADDVLVANYWSLSGNWFFGALSSQGGLRPAYHVLTGYARVLRGDLVELRVESPSFDSPEVGILPARRDLPLVVGLATRDAETVRLLVINKDPRRPAALTIRGPDRSISSIVCDELAAGRYFDLQHAGGSPGYQSRPTDARGFPFEYRAEPHSLTICEMRLGPGRRED
jgi:alpha-N-arabinofuranosidase